MSHNFRQVVTGTGIYISKSGHDSNAGTSPDAPKKSLSTIPSGAANRSIIGAGYYPSTIDGNIAGQASVVWADGLVVIDFEGSGNLSNNVNSLGGIVMNGGFSGGASFSGCSTEQRTLININGTPNHTVLTQGRRFIRCLIIQSQILATLVSNRYNNTFETCIIDKSNASGNIIQGKCFYDSYVGPDKIIQFAFAAAGAVPSITNILVQGNNTFANCNIQGLIRLPTSTGTQDYAIQDEFIGTPQDNGYDPGVNWLNEANLTADSFIGTVSGWDAVVATMINRSPEFLNAAGNNYNLMSNSPHLGTGYAGANIGYGRVGDYTSVTEDGVGTVSIIKSPEIDDSVPASLILGVAETEGYVRIIKFVPRTIQELIVDAQFLFDSDEAGGAATNNNVPDSEPLTADYASQTVTAASASPDTDRIIVPTGLIDDTMHVRVAGESFAVLSVTVASPNDTVIIDGNFRATVVDGIAVTFGTEAQLAVLNPNRLAVQMRVSKNSISNPPDPAIDSDWDNDVDAGYGVVGNYFHQEIGEQPGLYIITGVVYGAGDSNRPAGGTLQEIGNCWVDVKVWLRDNFNHEGIAV